MIKLRNIFSSLFNRRPIKDEDKKEEVEKKDDNARCKVVIVSCSRDFFWYDRLIKEMMLRMSKGKFDEDTPEGIASRTFEVELFESDVLGEVYRTIEDVAGPGCKGFICKQDTKLA